MNPSGDGLRERASTSPALFNRCVLNWFGDWSSSALYQVVTCFKTYWTILFRLVWNWPSIWILIAPIMTHQWRCLPSASFCLSKFTIVMRLLTHSFMHIIPFAKLTQLNNVKGIELQPLHHDISSTSSNTSWIYSMKSDVTWKMKSFI